MILEPFKSLEHFSKVLKKRVLSLMVMVTVPMMVMPSGPGAKCDRKSRLISSRTEHRSTSGISA